MPLPAGVPEDLSCIRPEAGVCSPDAAGALGGRITRMQYVGDRTEFWIDTPIGVLTVVEISSADRRSGDRVGLQVDPRDVKFLNPA